MNVDLGLNNPENYVLTDNRINNYMVLIFTDLKKLRIIKYHTELVHIKKMKCL